MTPKIRNISEIELADHYLSLAAKETIRGMHEEQGGPFGSTIVRNGEVVVAVGNTVMKEMDPSGHAEMVAVREACKKLDTLDLSDCVVYATCEPCPMCVSVMLWAGIKEVYYVSDRFDAAVNGFSDMHLRHYLDHTDTSPMTMEQIGPHEECNDIWTEFQKLNKDNE